MQAEHRLNYRSEAKEEPERRGAMFKTSFLLAAASVGLIACCPYERDVAYGTLVGAGLGAVVGHNLFDEAEAGAVIGGLFGAASASDHYYHPGHSRSGYHHYPSHHYVYPSWHIGWHSYSYPRYSHHDYKYKYKYKYKVQDRHGHYSHGKHKPSKSSYRKQR